MSVSNGQNANATSFNNAFVSKTNDSTVVGTITLNNPSSASIASAQDSINQALAVADTVTTLSAEVVALDERVDDVEADVAELVGGSRGQFYDFDLDALQDVSFSSGTSFAATGLLLPENMCVDKVVIVPTEQFAGTGFTGAKAWIGAFGGDNYSYMPITDVGGAPGETNWKSNLCCDVHKFGEAGGNGFDVYVEITGCNISDLTGGGFKVYFYYSNIGAAVETGWR